MDGTAPQWLFAYVAHQWEKQAGQKKVSTTCTARQKQDSGSILGRLELAVFG
jgi:hypothetical protein